MVAAVGGAASAFFAGVGFTADSLVGILAGRGAAADGVGLMVGFAWVVVVLGLSVGRSVTLRALVHASSADGPESADEAVNERQRTDDLDGC